MSHTARITEQQRALFMLMIDQSGSMSEQWSVDTKLSKAQMVARVCNVTLTELVARCRDGSNYRHYFDIGVIGYSGRGVHSLLPGAAWLLSPAQLAGSARGEERIEHTHRAPDGALLTLHSANKVWIEPSNEGKTPMYGAFSKLLEIMLTWRASQKSLSVFPPTIINITDGEPTDATIGSLSELIERIRSNGTQDGEPIIFNVHISSHNSQSIIFPEKLSELPLEAELLYTLSSHLPESFKSEISDLGSLNTNRPLRAMAYNAGVEDLIRIMNIGSSTMTSHK